MPTQSKSNWVDVDLAGFGQLMANRPKVAVLHDLLQNVFDEDATSVKVWLYPVDGRRGVSLLSVEDDCPAGFADLRDAYTLYKASKKKGDPTKRGRFNEGEKFVLSLCEEASISTTTGTVVFNGDGRRLSKKKTASGSIFEGLLKVTRGESAEMVREVKKVLVPDGFTVEINGERISQRRRIRSVLATLQTITVDDEGCLKHTSRVTHITLHPTLDGEDAYLYEMGIPVVSIDTPWHVNVGQKVPLNRDRDNVTPGYRRDLLAAVLDTSVDLLTDGQAGEGWVKDALPKAKASTVSTATDKMFGKGWVIATPSDREADKNAIANGKTVVSGGSLGKDAWSSIKASGSAVSSATKYSLRPDAGNRPPKLAKETKFVVDLREYCEAVAEHLLDRPVSVEIWNDRDGHAGYFRGDSIVVNLAGALRDAIALTPESLGLWVDDLLIHECAHDSSGDHLTMAYINACTRLGAKVRSFAHRAKFRSFAHLGGR